MSDGRKCFQQLLLQWVEHIQSIPKQIKSSGQSDSGGGGGECGGGGVQLQHDPELQHKYHQENLQN